MNNLNDFYEFVNKHSLFLALFIIAIIELVKHFLQKKVEVAFVEQISKIQEEVKAEFVKQNETIKAELSFSNQHKLNLMAIEREAVFDFNKSYGTFYQLLSDFTFVLSINISTFKSIDFEDRISQIKNVHNAYIIASNHLVLFYNNVPEFLSKRENLNNKIIAYSYLLQNKLSTIQLDISFKEIDLINKGFGINNEIEAKSESKLQMIDRINKSNSDFFLENIESFRQIKISYDNLIEYLSDKLKA